MIPPNNQFATLVSSNFITDNPDTPPISAAAIIEDYANQLAQFNAYHMQKQFDSIFAELHRAADARKEQINVLSNFMTSVENAEAAVQAQFREAQRTLKEQQETFSSVQALQQTQVTLLSQEVSNFQKDIKEKL